MTTKSEPPGVPQIMPYNRTLPPLPLALPNQFPEKTESDINNNGIKEFTNSNNFKNNKVTPFLDVDNMSELSLESKAYSDFEVVWHNLSYTLSWMSIKSRSRRNILMNLNGFFRSSEVIAIMGPSGSGKSTLLEIICGRRKRGVDGEVNIRGTDYIKVGFVPQDNHLLDLLSVKESFIFASKVINVLNPNFDHNGIADKLIHRFGLSSVIDTKANRCSGGQRKRLSIALEVISKPNILILDEPTTGLDSPSCSHVVQIMKELVSDTQQPTAIVTTIHQPSVATFNGFDSVYVLSGMGECIYHGTPQNLLSTLNKVSINCDPHTSPSDFIIEVAAGDYGQIPVRKMVIEAQGYEMERLVTNGTKSLASASQLISHPFWPHFKLLFMRSQVILYRDPLLTILRILMAVSTAVSLCSLFPREVGKVSGCLPRELELYTVSVNDLSKKFVADLMMIMQNVGLLFCGIMIGFIGGLTPTLLNFPKEMHVFNKEYHNGWYSCIPYYLAKVLVDIPLQIITPLIYILIVYFYTNQPREWMRFIMLTLLSVLLSFVAQSIGECAGAAFMEDQQTAVIAGGLIPMPMILFGGFLVRIERMPPYLRPLSWLSILRFGFEAMLISVYGFDRCEYSYREWLTTVNVSAIKKPLWAQSLPIMMEYMNNKNNPGGVVADPSKVTDDGLESLYSAFGGAMLKGINLNKALILSYFKLDDDYMWTALAILIAYMIGLKFLTYFVLMAKLRSKK